MVDRLSLLDVSPPALARMLEVLHLIILAATLSDKLPRRLALQALPLKPPRDPWVVLVQRIEAVASWLRHLGLFRCYGAPGAMGMGAAAMGAAAMVTAACAFPTQQVKHLGPLCAA